MNSKKKEEKIPVYVENRRDRERKRATNYGVREIEMRPGTFYLL